VTVDVKAERRADVLKALAEPTRWRIVEALVCEELCVCHLTELLDLAQPTVSHHLKALRDAGIVESEQHRQWVYYRLRPAVLGDLAAELADAASSCPTGGPRRRPCC
jgi:ArsR family transcriptional regulator